MTQNPSKLLQPLGVPEIGVHRQKVEKIIKEKKKEAEAPPLQEDPMPLQKVIEIGAIWTHVVPMVRPDDFLCQHDF